MMNNLDKIAQIFPECITESRDDDGNLTRAVNFDVLKEILGEYVSDNPEHYQFTWVGKSRARLAAQSPTDKTLRPCPAESLNWDSTENLYIEGDNLDVLKILLESYLHKVKMIYIDPPYNTGNDFIYKDDFTMDEDDYNKQINLFDDDGNRNFKQNNSSNPRFHSDWCSMIFSRLLLAKHFLADDGVIFISIDDNEQANLKKICDEVFGEKNFVGNILWEGNGKNDSTFISESHEYILIFAKNLYYLKNNKIRWRVNKTGIKEINDKISELKKIYGEDYKIITLKLREWFQSLNKNHPSWKHKHYSNVDKRGVYFAGDISAESGRGREHYTVLHPITQKPCKMPARGFPTKKTMEEWIKNGYVDFGENEDCVPKRKRYLDETDKYVLSSVIYKDSRTAFKDIFKIFDTEIFNNPKDVSIIKLLVEISTDKDAVVMDFFSGSATTAHAVMQLNAEDGGRRKFIMVQLPEVCAANSEAAKAGYKNICEIGKERIRRAGQKILAEKGLFPENLDVGFRVFKPDSSNMKDVYRTAAELTQEMLTEFVTNIKEDRTALDLLFGYLLKCGVEINKAYTSEQVDGFTIHNYNDGELIACFEENVSRKVIEYIADKKPVRAVFRDSSFATSPDKINANEIFKYRSPDTKFKVI